MEGAPWTQFQPVKASFDDSFFPEPHPSVDWLSHLSVVYASGFLTDLLQCSQSCHFALATTSSSAGRGRTHLEILSTRTSRQEEGSDSAGLGNIVRHSLKIK